LATIDERLQSYRVARDKAEYAIRATHGRGSGRALRFRPEGARDRVPLFQALLNLAIVWGSLKTEWAVVRTRLSGYEREWRTLANDLERLRRKADKAGDSQGNLFR
jgi:hypothetical protein